MEQLINDMPFLMDQEAAFRNCCLGYYCNVIHQYDLMSRDEANAFIRRIQNIEAEKWGRRETGYWHKRQPILCKDN